MNGTKQTPAPVTFVTLSRLVALTPAAAHAEATMTAGPSEAAGNNMLWNGAFDTTSLRHGASRSIRRATARPPPTSGELCVKIDDPGKQRFDVVMRQRPLAIAKGHKYQLRFKTRATAPTKLRPRISKISVPYTELWARDRRRRRDAARRTPRRSTARSTTTTSSWRSSSAARWPASRR